jgi:hypothetical protein
MLDFHMSFLFLFNVERYQPSAGIAGFVKGRLRRGLFYRRRVIQSASLPADEDKENRDQERVERAYPRVCYFHVIFSFLGFLP